MKPCSSLSLLALALLASTHLSSNAWAVQYPTIDPAFSQQIYSGPLVGGPGMAWTTSSHLLTRNGSDILEYNPTQNATHLATSIHGVIATHTISGLSNTGYGMSNGLDGYIYTVTGNGLERFNPANWAAPAQLMPGSVAGAGYGVTTLPDGRIAYSDGFGTSSVYVYDPVALTNTLVYTAPVGNLIDGMVAGPAGHLALAIQSSAAITVITAAGSLVNTFATPHFPDGLAFSSGALNDTLFSNNNDGTISKYVLAPGFLGVPIITDIATGSGAYGDLASVGPDCAFYVSQFDNGGYHGCTPGVGTNWDLPTTNSEPSIIRISGASLTGIPGDEACEFYSPLETYFLPEPGSLLLLAGGLLPLLTGRRRRRADAILK